MIPQWVSGAAARDAMYRRQGGGGGGGGSSSGSGNGILSFGGVALIAGGTLAQALDGHLGGFLASVLTGLAVIAAWWAAFRAKGALGAVAGAAVAVLASYSLYAISEAPGGSGWFWPAVVLVLVGLDQWVWKKRNR